MNYKEGVRSSDNMAEARNIAFREEGFKPWGGEVWARGIQIVRHIGTHNPYEEGLNPIATCPTTRK